MLRSVIAVTLSLVVLTGGPSSGPVEAVGARPAAVSGPGPVAAATPDDTVDTTRDTINEFLPEERGLGDCISALPKPGCGSEARGGWRQGLVFLSILAGLAFIAWRVVVSARRTRAEDLEVTTGTPADNDDERRP